MQKSWDHRLERGLCILLAPLLWMSGCDGSSTTGYPSAANQLPVSLNEIMVALVNDAADPIWVAAWREPETEADWRALERKAYQLQVAGALLELPGSGPMDAAWAADPLWQRWSQQLEVVGGVAVAAAKNRDLANIAGVGEQIVVVCEGCHLAFKPDQPSGKLYGELSPTEQDFDALEVR
ncbi:MAG: hypothetical protein ACR2PZ_20390 [Pseudomonadales bacterium]